MIWLDRLLGKKQEEPEEPEQEPIRLIPDETLKVIQQAIDAVTDYIVRESQKKASQEGHPMEITPKNVIDVINSGEIKIRIEKED